MIASLRLVPGYAVEAHGGVAGVEHFELVVFITRFEDELSIVLPGKPGGHNIVGTDILLYVVLAPVLHNEGLQLLVRVGYSECIEAYLHLHLLVSLVDIDVGVSGDAEADAHQQLGNSELHDHHLAVFLIFDDVEAVVTALFQP